VILLKRLIKNITPTENKFLKNKTILASEKINTMAYQMMNDMEASEIKINAHEAKEDERGNNKIITLPATYDVGFSPLRDEFNNLSKEEKQLLTKELYKTIDVGFRDTMEMHAYEQYISNEYPEVKRTDMYTEIKKITMEEENIVSFEIIISFENGFPGSTGPEVYASKKTKKLQKTSSEKMKPNLRSTLNKIVDQYTTKSEYSKEIPINEIISDFREEGIALLQEDGTEYEGILSGSEGKAKFNLAIVCNNGTIDPIDNAMLVLNWYRMESGNYEIVSYVS
jgi:hypothetical protein